MAPLSNTDKVSPNFPRLRGLALFGRRLAERVDCPLLAAPKNQHNNGRSIRRNAQVGLPNRYAGSDMYQIQCVLMAMIVYGTPAAQRCQATHAGTIDLERLAPALGARGYERSGDG